MQNCLNCGCLFMRNEVVNDQGVKIEKENSDRFMHRLIKSSVLTGSKSGTDFISTLNIIRNFQHR